MRVNADFQQRVAQRTSEMTWKASPMPGVSRRMLDRIGDEVARATSIVRYDPDSQFSAHVHSGGEEFMVLEGVFQDEHGDFPEGTYVRNPINTAHTPASESGCTIFVKLWQFHPEEKEILRVDTDAMELAPVAGRDGVSAGILYKDEHEEVRVETWAPNTDFEVSDARGVEILVLRGEFTSDDERFDKHAWIRLPEHEVARISTGTEGARVWVKTGHLTDIQIPTVGKVSQ